MNNNSGNSYFDAPNQSNRYGLVTRSLGRPIPSFSTRNAWSRSDLIVNRGLLDDPPPSTYSRTASSNVDYVPPSHTPHQIPIRTSNNLRRQHLEALRQAVHNQRDRTESNSRSASSQDREKDHVLKHLTKQIYNPVPKSQLLRNLSLYYRNKNQGSGNSRNPQGYSGEEDDEKRCTVCLDDFEPKETVMLTPCKHMFHEECIVQWLKTKGQCPLCRFVILKPTRRDYSPGVSSDLAGDMTVNDLFTLELISVVRAMEESFLFGYPRRM
ncbi:RING/U-box superfamily protein [Raphanus sativus]|uniref:RING-type E3 ubiquitin transferase n=1 Tax=Raphanus sativus TaxID=3726 RepID=A0A6J0K3C0_RAPSA|nr:E3 ubiquitin-protein ligase SDIR1 [Raphanus sativus]KAJ4885019.1 RING/U-box superfamily protein [Raphanus sativus]